MTASRLCILGFVTAGLLVTALAQAQQPSPASKTATAAAQSPATAAAQPAPKAIGRATEARPARSASAEKPTDVSAQLIRDARDAGFKPTQVRGSLMYCRTAVELGSNFPVRTCYNEQQTKVKIEEYRAQRRQLQQGRFLPPGMPAGCSSRACQ